MADTRNEKASIAMAIGAVSSWTRNPLIPNGHELGSRAACRQRGVRVDQPFALDDGGQVGVDRRVEERGQDGRQTRDQQELPVGQDAQREGDGDRAEQDRTPEIRPDQHRSTP
jgi:hypothetical protein